MELVSLHVDYEFVPDRLSQPRVVLVANGFPELLIATVVWLTEQGLDIALQRFQAYPTATDTLVSLPQLYPWPDVDGLRIGR